GVSRKTGYKWIDRYVRHGPAGLEEASPRPRRSPNQTSEEIVSAILDARRRHPRWGGKKLLALLQAARPLPVPKLFCNFQLWLEGSPWSRVAWSSSSDARSHSPCLSFWRICQSFACL